MSDDGTTKIGSISVGRVDDTVAVVVEAGPTSYVLALSEWQASALARSLDECVARGGSGEKVELNERN